MNEQNRLAAFLHNLFRTTHPSQPENLPTNAIPRRLSQGEVNRLYRICRSYKYYQLSTDMILDLLEVYAKYYEADNEE